ncbi:alpha/beta fold hydrolase [Aquimarina gracilis]|uniref:Alpha/beta fold hydrolase n=1 Tax=Aquimarina gracilis TaxID=874422 RepID=A0ABU6A1X2_9FLAO|nr:alpha/beta fold hydrolase [Aquimarina gracilis]MEB3348091.1 alpha/beta fold hydrolase [Aquimarina gracilis]
MPKLKKILGFGFFAVLFYSIIIIILYIFQENILFQPEELSDDYVFQFDHPFEEFFIETEEGVCLNGLHFTNENPKGVILYFHGNRGNLRRWGEIVVFFAKKQYDVVVMDYRSYGKSKGEITEKNLYNDAQLFYNYVLRNYPEDQITVYGRSIGTGIATKIASQNQPCNLILETPYYDIKDIVESWFPHFPTDALLRYKIPSGNFIQEVTCTVTIFHGTNDGVVPYKTGTKLFKSIPTSNKEMITIPGGSHNDLIEFQVYHETIDKVLRNAY